jgi:hypothetical protein
MRCRNAPTQRSLGAGQRWDRVIDIVPVVVSAWHWVAAISTNSCAASATAPVQWRPPMVGLCQGEGNWAVTSGRLRAMAEAYDACVDVIDRCADQLRRGILTPGEYYLKLTQAIEQYLYDDDPGDDLDLLLRYARSGVESTATRSPLSGDRVAVERFDRTMRALLHRGAAEADLAARLDRVRAAHRAGGPEAADDLRELCRRGWRDHPTIFMFCDCIMETLATAVELCAIGALVDAIHPRFRSEGQIAAPDLFGGRPRTRVLDLLGSLATQDDAVGAEAIDALIELAGHFDTAGVAVVRLPPHRLTMAHRSRLHALLDSYEDLLERDPILEPSDEVIRLPDVIRSMLWLANDADKFV